MLRNSCVKRFYAGETGDFLHLDTAPLMGAIDKEVAALNGAPTAPNSSVSTERDGRHALLSKLKTSYPQFLTGITKEKALTPDLEKLLKSALDDVSKSFAA